MIDENIGIRMCKHKRIRREYGTIVYNPITVVLPNPKIHYDEIHQLMKKVKKQDMKEKKVTKKIDIRKMTKEDQIKDLVDLSQISGSPAKEEPKEESPKEESPKEEPVKEEPVKEGPKEEEAKGESKEEEEEEEEPKEQKQKSGLLKRIMVTNMSRDKDKEMFQM
jgi:hypothetical protein